MILDSEAALVQVLRDTVEFAAAALKTPGVTVRRAFLESPQMECRGAVHFRKLSRRGLSDSPELGKTLSLSSLSSISCGSTIMTMMMPFGERLGETSR